jgi:hypothetical protein
MIAVHEGVFLGLPIETFELIGCRVVARVSEDPLKENWSWFLGQRVKVDRPTKGTIHDGKAQTVFG